MKLEAKSRLQSRIRLESDSVVQMPVRNDSQRGYLVVIALMLNGDRPLGRDCRAAVARYLIQNPTTAGYINLVGYPDTEDQKGNVYHTFLVDTQHRKLADAYDGRQDMQTRTYVHRANQEVVANPIIASVYVKDFMHHLISGTFKTWVKQYPN